MKSKMAQTLLLLSNPQPRWHLRKPPLLLHLLQLYGTSEVDQCGSPATFLPVCLGVEKSIPNSSPVEAARMRHVFLKREPYVSRFTLLPHLLLIVMCPLQTGDSAQLGTRVMQPYLTGSLPVERQNKILFVENIYII